MATSMLSAPSTETFIASRRSNDSGPISTFSKGTTLNGLASTNSFSYAASNPSISDSLTNGGSSSSTTFPELEGKDPAQHLEILESLLEKENRIKEGAENLLSMQLMDNLRIQVESELDLANNKIETIKSLIEAISSNRTLRKKPSNLRLASPAASKKKSGQRLNARFKEDLAEKDDFRTAKQQAYNSIKTLIAYSRHTFSPASISSASSSASRPPPTTEEELNQARIEHTNRLIEVLRSNVRVKYELDINEIIQAVLPSLSDYASKKLRATAYRALRHAIIDVESVEKLLEYHIDWFMVKTLSKDNKSAVEREQAIKLIREIVEIGSERRAHHASAGAGSVPLSESIMRAIISIAEHPEDPFRQICVETLVEIMLVDIDLMARTGGLRVILQSISDGPPESGPILATSFLYIIDAPKTRAYLHPGTDIEIALSGINDAYGKGTAHADRMRACSKTITVMLRTWSGLMYLCINDMQAIRSIIDNLRIPSLETREVILDMFFELLNIKPPEWYQTFIDGRRLTMYRRHRPPSHPQKDIDAANKPPKKLKLTDQYISLLLLILTKAGLMEALTAMMEETTTGSALSRKAMLLVGEILHIANRVLPLHVASQIQTMPRIFELAADYVHREKRLIGISALAAIDSFNRNRARLEPPSMNVSRQRANSVEDPVRRGQRQVEQVRIKMGMQMDDKTFQSWLIDTQVMQTKDHNKWNFEVLQDLVEGPLLNPKRLEEAIKVSKFVKRLMTFYYPFSHRFCNIKKTRANMRWVKLGCTLLSSLMANPDGVKYLANEDEFLPQIVRSFTQLGYLSGAPDSDPIFSKKRVEDTLTFGYLEMLGTLSKQKDGLELMERFKVFTALYHLSELRSREDLIKGIIENIDYTNDGHSRILLSKALTSSYKHIRLYATRHLGKLIQETDAANAWILRLLLTQLYDPATEVCEMAVHFLQEACESIEILKIVVEMQPTLEHLGEIGHPLLLKFMSTAVGFRYLFDIGYIEREMDMWFHERNFHYVVEVEVYLSKELNFNPMEDDEDDTLTFEGTAPPHFYGEMAKTELGCQILRKKGHFAEFAHFIRQHGLESEDFEIILKLKSILWAVGNIGATERGLLFLEEEEVISIVLEIAEQSPLLSVRGTCFFALGLVSTTPQGADVLEDFGWEATLSPMGTPTGLCIPGDVEKFVAISAWEQPAMDRSTKLLASTDQEEVDVLTAIQNLANTVIANTASRSLAKMKSRPEYRRIFSSPYTFYRVFHLLSAQRFRLPVRRFILELFDVQLDGTAIRSMADAAQKLKDAGILVMSPRATKLQPRVVSTFGRPTHSRNASGSDGEEDLMFDTPTVDQPKPQRRPISLLPAKRIVGFDDI